jgi:hypothetical protein
MNDSPGDCCRACGRDGLSLSGDQLRRGDEEKRGKDCSELHLC